ncbi:Receptor-like protein 12 [Nymphaea thermarum]|nr:Receptor-like protein 12 [Nymphaea thermarum]
MGQGAAAIAQALNPLLLRRSTIIFLGLFVIGVVCASKDETPPPPPTSTATRGAASRICLSNQSSALLQFKNNNLGPGVLSSWQHNGSDCCHWEGVTCNNLTGFVIALEIPDRDLGTMTAGIAADSSLFKLRYLQRLDLSNNIFVGDIPKRLVELTHLTHLNLSHCEFTGQIPVELSQMTRLVSLDLSYNRGLLLQHPNFSQLFRGLVHLEQLRLDGADVSMSLVDVSMSLSSSHDLQTLSLSGCNISGPMDESSILEGLCSLGNITSLRLRANSMTGAIPPCLFSLPSLKELDLGRNRLTGSIPNLQLNPILSSLTELDLSGNRLTGSIPSSLFNLSFLATLDLSHNLLTENIPSSHFNVPFLKKVVLSGNSLTGTIPSWLFNLSSLEELQLSSNRLLGIPSSLFNPISSLKAVNLSDNSLSRSVPSWLFNLSSLDSLDLSNNFLTGVPSVLFNSNSSLTTLDLSHNNLMGRIPPLLFTLPSLRKLNLGSNKFGDLLSNFDNNLYSQHLEFLQLDHNFLSGDIPSFVNRLPDLKSIDLSSNCFNVTVDLSFFFSIKGLFALDLSNNTRLTVDSSYSSDDAQGSSKDSPGIQYLKLNSCNIWTFPRFVCKLSNLEYLELSNNNIEGEIPSCLWWEPSRFDTLVLDHNKLHGFEEPAQGISLNGVLYMSVSNNRIEGEIPTFLCDLAPTFLDMSENSLTGDIPDCLVKNLGTLNLRKNQLGGQIPDEFKFVEFVVLSDNLLTGKIPKSLFSSMLRVLDLGNNKLNGSFPSVSLASLLGNLGMLQVLILRSNHLHGPITVDASQQEFHWLKIFDISSNYFSGSLPHELFRGFKAMVSGTPEKETYLLQPNWSSGNGYWERDVTLYVEETIKGEYRLFKEVTKDLIIIDLSSNNFTGRIPQEIGSLTSLYVLNISRNHLVGSIPESFGKLQQMESLDLSHNQLSGVIPKELSVLTFLEVLDLSYNDLHGMIPQGNQFSTFLTTSFEGNPKLCGLQVNRSCSHAVGDGPHAGGDGLVEEENRRIKEKGWKYGSVGFGFAVGLVITTLPFLLMNRVTDWYWNRTDRMIDFILQRTLEISNNKELVASLPPGNLTEGVNIRLSYSTKQSNQWTMPAFLRNHFTDGYLDLSKNTLAGKIPDCFYYMDALKLRKNQLRAQIPRGFNNIKLLDLNHKFLTGKIPKSLSNCTRLKAQYLGNNRLHDVFPDWLGQLSELNTLDLLRSNNPYGPISAFSSTQAFLATI